MNALHANSDFLPHSIEAEQGLLGAVLLNADALTAVDGLIESEMLFEPIHQKIWSKMCAMSQAGKGITPRTLNAELGPDAAIDMGGIKVSVYIARMAAEATTVINAPDFAKTIRELWQRRRLINVSREIQARALGGFDSEPVNGLLEELDTELHAIRFGNVVDGAIWIGEAADRAFAQTAKAHEGNGKDIYSTGIQTIDRVIGPLIAGDFVTILGESGHGKSALAMQIMRALSMRTEERPEGEPFAFISQEMGAVSLARRQMAALSGISTQLQRSGYSLNQSEFERLRDAADNMKPQKIIIDESGRQKTSSMIKKLRAMKKRYDIKGFAIDHSRLIKPEHPKHNEIETITNAAPELKQACKELDLIGFLLAQPSSTGMRESVRWRLTDRSIYGGDAIRQNSDMVLSIAIPYNWLVNREPDPADQREHEKWEADCIKYRGLGEFCAIKLRDGEKSGWETLTWNGQQTRFGDR
jgi:replicative DNA helicase